MTSSLASIIYTPEEKTVIFFRQLKKELCIGSTQRIVTLVRQILGHVRKGLSGKQTSIFLNRLPELIQMLMLKDWEQNQENVPSYAHLDELVDVIYEEDKKSGNSFFASEVEALNAVIIVLRRLDRHIDLFNYQVLKSTLVQELRQVPLEDASESY